MTDSSISDDDGADDTPDVSSEPTFSGESPRTARTVSIAVGVVLVGLIALLALSGGGEDEDGVSPLLAQRTPAVAGATLGGGQFDIDDHRGSWVLVNFFATWCPGCVNEHDDLVELERWGASEGDLQLVSVVFNDPVERVEEFFAERGGTWPVLEDRGGTSGDFGVVQIPESFLVSPSGQVVFHREGEIVAEQIITIIEDIG